MRRGWTIPAILQHTYYQLKYIFEEDQGSDRKHYGHIAAATRASGATKEEWASYCKQVGL